MPDFKIKYVIDADAKKAKAEINEVDGLFGRIGGAAGDVVDNIGGIGGAAMIAGAGLVTLATTVAAGTAAIYELSKSAADFGSEIFDASEKTGLSAETLSAMKFAADQSGTSLDQVTSAIAKFGKQVGSAVDGSKEATAALKALGIEPQEAMSDLDGALEKVFKRILEARPGLEQITLAQKAFGKSGADLLPFLKSFDGDLSALVARAKELGVTIDDEAARAADEFGDQLDTLSAQIAGVGRSIGQEFMPIFMDMATGLSQWLAENKGEVRSWATNVSDLIRGVAVTMREINDTSKEVTGSSVGYWLSWAMEIHRHIDPVIFVYTTLLEKMRQVGAESRRAAGLGGQLGGSVSPFLGAADDTPATTGAGPKKSFRNAAAEAERAERERIQRLRTGLQQELAIQAERVELTLARNEAMLAQMSITEDEHIAARQKIQREFVTFKLELLDRELQGVQGNAAEEDRVRAEILKTQMQREKLRYNATKENEEQSRRNFEAELKREKQLHQVEKMRLLTLQLIKDLPAPNTILPTEEPPLPKDAEPGLMNGLFGGDLALEMDDFISTSLYLQDTLQTLGEIGQNAFGQLADGFGSMIENWVLFGDAGPDALRKMTAAVLANVAAQSAVLAIFELAKGFAALFWNPAEAAAHFKAAALFGGLAAGAALSGRAIAGDSFKKDGGGGGSGAGSNGGSRSQERDMTPISRQSEDTFISGRNAGPWAKAAEAIDRLEKKISSMRPEDVVTAGFNRKPGLAGNAVVNDIKRNASTGTNLKRVMGDR